MEKKFTHENYEWNIDGLVKCINENNLKSELIYYTESTAIVHVVSYADSQILGAESDWCISQHKESWKQYVEDTKGIQLFFYCFNQPIKSDYCLYGATFTSSNSSIKLDCCFTKYDKPIKEVFKSDTDELAISYVLRKDFGIHLHELSEVILDIFKNDSKTSQFENTVFDLEEEISTPYLTWIDSYAYR